MAKREKEKKAKSKAAKFLGAWNCSARTESDTEPRQRECPAPLTAKTNSGLLSNCPGIWAEKQ